MTSIWTSALSRLSSKIAPQNYDMWLRPIECRTIDGDRIVLRAPNQYVRSWFEKNYLPILLDELRNDTGQDFEVTFEIQEGAVMSDFAIGSDLPGASPPGLSARGDAGTGLATAVASSPAIAPVTEAPVAPGSGVPSGLNRKYVFDTFVAGPSNQLAHAAARAVASPDPPKYNPLFICGGVGLGKTHLLHAIGNEILTNRPGARVLYLSGERFMNDYIHSIRNGKMHDFRRRYREDCDVLLLDDIQFIANKDSTQEEFFHTFNSLYEQQRQMVLCADRKPHEIPDIADRLRTRFAWGLLADIEPPELEVRVAILRKKADAEGIVLSDDVSLYIATAIKSNVRELEGALIRLAAYGSLSGRPLTLEYARESLEGSIARPPEHMTVDQVLKVVASYYQVKIIDLRSERRHKSIAGPRAVAMYLARKHTGESYPDLGRAFGNKHHTTVMSAEKKIAEKLKLDHALRSEVAAIENLLLR